VARIGLISDIHGRLRPEVFELLQGVDRILFAGDVERLELLDELESIAPLDAVWGNVDGPDIRRWTRESVEVEVGGVMFAVTHGDQVHPRYELLLERFPAADVIVHGHTHRPKRERFGSRWIVNPGAATKARGDYPPSVAVAELADGEVHFVHLALPGGEAFTPK
jgi:putative phosphoesterase